MPLCRVSEGPDGLPRPAAGTFGAMSWWARSSKTQGAAPVNEGDPGTGPVPPVPALPVRPDTEGLTREGSLPASPTPAGGSGRYGPRASITHFDTAPDEFAWQLPINGELYRVIPGPDRPDYSIMLLERPLHVYPGPHLDLRRVDHDLVGEDRQGRPMARAHALVVCARFTGQQLHPGMTDLPVNIAVVIAESVLTDAQLDFAKISYAATGFLSEGHGERANGSEPREQEPVPPEEAPPDPAPPTLLDEVMRAVGAALRQGIGAQRGTEVAHVHARLTLDPQRRISGLSGNADSGPPDPTRVTFDAMNRELARLSDLDREVTGVTMTISDAGVSYRVDDADG